MANKPKTSDYRLHLTRHAERQIESKGFEMDDIRGVYEKPVSVYRSGSHPGQHRIVGKGLCLVGEFREDAEFRLVTVYKDRVVTPPRTDQLETAEGRQYAEKYLSGEYKRSYNKPKTQK